VNLNWMQRKIIIIGVYASSESEEVNTKNQFLTNRMIADMENPCSYSVTLMVEQEERLIKK